MHLARSLSYSRLPPTSAHTHLLNSAANNNKLVCNERPKTAHSENKPIATTIAIKPFGLRKLKTVVAIFVKIV